MMNTVERLCSSEFGGRRAGSPEHYALTDYLSVSFQNMGLSPLDADDMEGYKQPLNMRYALIKSKAEIKADLYYPASSGMKKRTFEYRGYNGKGGLNLKSKIAFVKYGIQDKESGYDDYADVDVNGKIVLLLSGTPANIKHKEKFTSMRKMLTAYNQGAIACIASKSKSISDEHGVNIGLSGPIADFPYITVDEKIAAELLSCKDSKSLMSLATGTTGKQADLKITPVCDPDRKTYNIIGIIPGSDPQLSDEYVMIGAHYDHLGSSGKSDIFSGADDNASGASVVMETARVISKSGIIPKRSIIFGLWTGEEAGLIGSNYFTNNPPLALKSIVSNIQIDMVGVGIPGSFMTTGASAFPEHYKYMKTSAYDLQYKLVPDQIAGASDHLAFARKKVPSSLLYSCGEHPYYHTVKDKPSTLNPAVLESAVRMAVLSVWRAANDENPQNRQQVLDVSSINQ
ncbi:MAG: M28 family peptidase [Armatimonadota bacterium]